jgi:Tol biopolymer transport system component
LLLVLGCIVLALVFALLAIWLIPNDGPQRPPAGSDPTRLPASTPLTAQQLLVPMKLDDNTDIYLGDINRDAPVKRLTTAPGSDSGPALSPDRRTVVYVHHERRKTLRVMAVDGTGDRALFDPVPPECAEAFRPAWNPVDPTMLAIACTDVEGRSGLYLVRTDGRVLRALPVGPSPVDDPTFSPDGQAVAYWAAPQASLDGGSIYTIPVTGGEAQQLTDSEAGVDADPAWSPDGEYIAFRRRLPNGTQNGNFDIFVVAADGSEDARSLISGIYSDQDPSWSPDGKQLAIKSNQLIAEDPNADRTRVWLVNLSAGSPRLLWTSGADGDQTTPAWSRR